MFERFTAEARAVVVAAQQIARDTVSRSVDSRHLLVAMIEHPGPARSALQESGAAIDAVAAKARADILAGGIDAVALAGIGIDVDAVRRRADAVFGPGALDRAARKPGRHIPFTPDAKKVLELALREAIRLKHREIRSAHLMLGMLRAESPGRALLTGSGVGTDALRAAVEERADAA